MEVRRRGAAAMSDAPMRIASVMTMPATSAASLSPARKIREMFRTSTATMTIENSGTRNGSRIRVLSGLSDAVPSAPSDCALDELGELLGVVRLVQRRGVGHLLSPI